MLYVFLSYILAFFASFLPAILFNIERKKLFWAGLAGSVGWIVYSTVLDVSSRSALATFCGAAFVTLYGETMARILKTPAAVFFLTGIYPLVPGINAFHIVQYAIDGNVYNTFTSLIDTISLAGAIAFGIMLVSTSFQFGVRLKEKMGKE
jgi:uncharacterized membrane protein YjjB (DUF3815 family)